MAGITENERDAMPFSGLNNYEVSIESQSARSFCCEKLENNGFAEFVRNYRGTNQGNDNPLNMCKYYDSESFNTFCKHRRTELSVMHMNIRRIAKHRGELIAYLDTLDQKFDIIVLSEIGDDGQFYLNEDFFPNYHVYSDTPNHNRYGGVAILIKKGIGEITIKDDLRLQKSCECQKCETENKWIELKTPEATYIVGGIYRHPNGNVQHFIKDLEDCIGMVPQNVNCILAGDININLMNYNHSTCFEYFTLLSSFNFTPCITTPTRITDDKATLIDHIFIRRTKHSLSYNISSGNLFCDITDHLPNFILVSRQNKYRINKDRPLTRIYSEKNIEKFKNGLHALHWDIILVSPDTDTCYDNFYSNVLSLYNNSFPLVKLSRKRARDKKWITPALKQSIKNKDKLYRKFIANRTPQNRTTYTNYKNILTTCLRQAEIIFYTQILEDKKKAVTNFWKYFGQTINPGKIKKSNHLQKIIVNNEEFTESKDIANHMNSFFCHIGENINKSLPKVQGHFKNYLQNKIQETFFLAPVSPNDVLKELLKLDSKKTAGPDGLRPKLLKAVATEIAEPLTILYNKSIENGHFPNYLKLAKVIALFKKGNRFEPENYRPISLLNCFGKIFEKLLYKQFIQFIEKHNILYLYQFGFRHDFSTTLALIDTIDDIKFHLDKGEYVLGVFLDIRKAFDSINHAVMLEKLEHYGFRGHSLKFLQSYLTNRQQFTVVNGQNSVTLPTSCGVPQGSVLGPLLFLLYVNDIQYAVQDAKARLFADDTSLLIHDKNLQNLINNTELNMRKLQTWFVLNGLSLSLHKSNFIIFHKSRHKNAEEIQKINIGEDFISRVKHTKYIGLTIDENLNWEHHINELCKSLSQYFGIFYNIRHYISPHIARSIYFACVYSKIKYGIEIYGSASTNRISKLQTLQNKLMKLLTKKEYRYDTNQLHSELNILKIKDIYKTGILSFVHNCVHGEPIEAFRNYFTSRDHIHTHNTRNSHHLITNRIKTEVGRSSTHYMGAILWNNLGMDLVQITDKHKFRKAVQYHFKLSY